MILAVSRARTARLLPLAVATIAAAFASAPRSAFAHQVPYSYVTIEVGAGVLRAEVAAHIVDLAHELAPLEPEQLLDSTVIARDRQSLERLLERRLDLRADGAALELEWTGDHLVPARRLVAFEFRASLVRAPGLIEVKGPLFPYDPSHQTFVNVREGDRMLTEDILDRDRTSARAYRSGLAGFREVVRTFIPAGTHHIFIGPDHILFVLGLMLMGGGVARLLRIVTAFTLAHSVTLALAATGLLQPPSRLIEPLIALSVVAIGAENLLAGGRRDTRAWLAFGFGFVHGFGFAGVLREFGLPRAAMAAALVSFNVGVELGQMAIVLASAPLLEWLRVHRPRAHGRVATVGSALVIAAGAYWFVQRIFFT
jgi:hypothetical protein